MYREYLYLLATDKKRGFIAGILKIFLLILSLFYGLVVRILSFIYLVKPYRLNCKVISIGNITLGGTGKTPLVEFLALKLKEQGHRVAVLSRGYKRLDTRYSMLDARCETMGDEPYMLSRNLENVSVIVDKNRISAAKKAIRDYQVDAVILDDGFQQWRIKKDLDIVTIDAAHPWTNSAVLPRGILREPLSSLARAHIFVLTKVNLNPDNQDIKELLKGINPRALIVEAIHKPVGFYKFGEVRDNLLSPDEFTGEKVSLVCGIADPESFEKLISKLGIETTLSFKFPDHYIYSEEDLNKIICDSRQNGINKIITTEKDSVRLLAMDYRLPALSLVEGWTMDCYVLRIKLEVLQDEIFIKRIHSLF
ncbi:MAG: tetraacyldisaccharide 4'-kinase [Candidatus Omnitrophica bacterium]|nr:tetraacyldisaccharide 4'-kinase [Candidatus Omnitrophota bacterium]